MAKSALRRRASELIKCGRAANDPDVLRESTNKFEVEGTNSSSSGVESDGVVSAEVPPLIFHVKVSVDPGGVLFALFGPNNGWAQDGIP